MTRREALRRPAGRVLFGLVLLAGLSVLGAERGRRAYSGTSDEPEHVQACRELRSGPGVVSNFEHPVLMKLIGAAGLPGLPSDRPEDEIRHARRLFPFVFGLLVLVSGGWAAYRAGPIAGLAVAAIVGLEPSLRGHAPLVHTDLLLTTLFVSTAAALDVSGKIRSFRTSLLILSGVVFGFALTAKYSALPFLPVLLVAATFRIRGFGRPPRLSPRRRRRDRGALPSPEPTSWRSAATRAFLLVGLPALLVGSFVQQAVVAGTTSKSSLMDGVDRKFRHFPFHQEAMSVTSALPRGFAAYAAGLYWVRASSIPGSRINYFLGEIHGKGSFLYFPVALALKLSTVTVLALLLAGAAGARLLFGRGPGRRRRRRLLAARALLPAFLGAAYAGAAMLSDVNIGVRHVFPAVPLFLVAAAGVARTASRSRLRTALCVGAVALTGLEAAAYLDREIPFGNRFAGGPGGLRRFLSDSNVDWGERLGKVFERAGKGDLGRVGVVSLTWDPVGAQAVGARLLEEFRPGDVDTVFVSVFVQDVGDALAKSRSPYPKIVEFREFLVPLLGSIHAEADRIEPFRDEYLLIRLRPALSPPAPSH